MKGTIITTYHMVYYFKNNQLQGDVTSGCYYVYYTKTF